MACVNVYDCRLILRAVFRESSVSVMVTTRLLITGGMFAGSTNTWKKTPWTWPAGGPRVVWVRFRHADDSPDAPLVVGPDVRRAYLPAVIRR